MVERTIAPLLKDLFRRYPFVTVTGPRQSGKTTLCRTALPELAYVNLESPEHRQFAEQDPKRFLATWPSGVILDEIQRVPSLLSWLQVFADDHGGNGLFVLTGSGQFLLSDAIDQSLAGRTALLRLLPFSIGELRSAGVDPSVDDMLFSGFYPRIHDQGLDPRQALGDYVETYTATTGGAGRSSPSSVTGAASNTTCCTPPKGAFWPSRPNPAPPSRRTGSRASGR